MGCFIEQINRRDGSLGEHVVVQSGVHLVDILDLQSNVECLRQGCDLYVVTLHGHGLYFLQSQNKILRREAGPTGCVQPWLPGSQSPILCQGGDAHLSRKQHSQTLLVLQKMKGNHFYPRPLTECAEEEGSFRLASKT